MWIGPIGVGCRSGQVLVPLGGQDLSAPAGVVGVPGVAAADVAGHAVAVVRAVDVVPGDVAAERAGASDVAAFAVAFEAIAAGHAVAVGAGMMRPLPGGVMVAAIVVTSLGVGHP